MPSAADINLYWEHGYWLAPVLLGPWHTKSVQSFLTPGFFIDRPEH